MRCVVATIAIFIAIMYIIEVFRSFHLTGRVLHPRAVLLAEGCFVYGLLCFRTMLQFSAPNILNQIENIEIAIPAGL